MTHSKFSLPRYDPFTAKPGFFLATVTERDFESQFFCNGSDGYLAWIDRVASALRAAWNN